MGCGWSTCQNLNTYDIFWMNKVQMRQCVVGRWRARGGLQVTSGH